MKKLILLVLSLNIHLVVYNQIIKGTVTDIETKLPIAYAVAYFDGTSVASYTDEKGSFTLDIKNNSSMPLTISALGYYSASINNFSPKKDISVSLTPKVFEMKDVSVNARANPNIRKQNLAIFRREFLGRTKNAKECEILNEDDIRFITSATKDTLRAISLKPIFIINKGLGYKITYYLNKFEYIQSKYLNQLIGNFIFDEDTISAEKGSDFMARRNNTYYGSKMHFMRALWQDSVNASGYTVKNTTRQLSYKDLVRKQLSNDPGQPKKIIYYYEPTPIILEIKWKPGKSESGMEILRNNIFFDQNGYYKGPGIIWHGQMAKQGIADLLPYDFQPSENLVAKSKALYNIFDTLIVDNSTKRVPETIENVYLQTDRDFYNPGDVIWFKSYVVDCFTHTLLDSSKILHVDFISPASKIIISKKIRLNHGLGNGEFTLPDSLNSGKYRLRAYTNYMRNFGEQIFFNRELTIINGSDNLAIVDYDTNFTDKNLNVSFFPEGGSLLENSSSLVAFKATNATGSGCNVTGEVYSSSGDLITSFRSSHLGMGTFTIRPMPGTSYYAIVKNAYDDIIRCEIPKSFSRGFILHARLNQYNEHLITLKTNSETLPRFLGRDLLVSISAHKRPVKSFVVKIDSLFNTFILPAEDLPQGIVLVTLYGLDNKPMCERMVYIQNNDEVSLIIETDKKEYKQRDSVRVKLFLNEARGTGQEAFLSLSATDQIYTNRTSSFPSTISSSFLLESEILGPIEEPSSYFDQSNPDRMQKLDLLLLTQGWRDFEWKYKTLQYIPETCFSISGRLRKQFLNVPLINHKVTIGLFHAGKSIITSVSTDSTGRFSLDLEELTGSARVIVSATDQKGNFQGMILLDSLEYSSAKIQTGSGPQKTISIKQNPELKNNLTSLRESDAYKKSIRKKYTLSDTILIDEVKIFARRKVTQAEIHINQGRLVYGQPDKEVVITPDLESFRSIKDLLVGRVAGIYFTQGGSGIRIRGSGSSLEMSSEPLFVLDGTVVSYAEISSIPVSWIDRIDIIMSEKSAAYGVRGANGIISVITRTSENIPYKPASYSINTTISGYDPQRIFYSPKYRSNIQAGYMPDLRSTLYWFPDIKVVTNQEYLLKYFNADISATYNIIIEGITSRGIPVTGKIEYIVK